ncbi:hypothetical protein [Pseudosulfitobacter sp. DSM 107133]|uniref:hypothetical protein n=1 Tax=Pseudosulfitobacter sp. DSM 107133 TaxID=2883100 RepID=UPI000DF3E087|nr:hypothetical protein [Pseudosulfitobacter sp. DSM 107133]UOA25342.1 hypothetical protein DSM107133_00014 [Pseudosulfitobacter sp. DSM 107133]
MAKSKSPKSGDPTEDTDKVTVDLNPDDEIAPSSEAPKEEGPEEDAKAEDAPAEDTPDEEIVLSEPESAEAGIADAPQPDATDTPEISDTETPTDRPEPETDADAPAQTPTQTIVPTAEPKQSGSRFWPLVLGGVVAAGLGFVAGKAPILDPMLPQSWRSAGEDTQATADLAAMEQTISQLRGEIEDLRGQISAAPEDSSDAVNALAASVEQLASRVEGLERLPQPSADATGNADVTALTDQMAQQQAQIDKLLQDAQLMQNTAATAAGNTLARAAVTRVLAAVDSGAPFDSALADVAANSDIEIPPALQSVAETGVVPLSELQQTLPDAARAALAAARTNATDAAGGFSGFLKRQLGARSVQPREGNDPDAILSRVEAATRQGHLGDALAEAETLPDPAKAELQSWMDAATARLEAMNAAETLMQRLAAN